MKILFYLGHPAHYHLFKNLIAKLKINSHNILVLIKKKDILENLLIESNIEYKNILPEGRKDNKLGIILGLIKRDIKIFFEALKFKPNLMLGTSTEITHVGKLLNIKSIIVNEDDYSAVPLFAKLGYPFASTILAPISCKTGKIGSRWENKTVKYKSFHELAYLHPNNFTPNIKIVSKYIDISKPFYILRFAKLTAHHDVNKSGLSTSVIKKIIDILNKFGNIYITSERKLEKEFEPYKISIPVKEIHHVLAYADIYIGDSQTMAAEAAVLGTPSIRFNDFVGELGYLEELEKYGLTIGIKTNDKKKLIYTVTSFVNNENLKEIQLENRKKMLLEKIDYTDFMLWFVENYPKSIKIIKKSPDYQDKFK